jgi:hypothetical protein
MRNGSALIVADAVNAGEPKAKGDRAECGALPVEVVARGSSVRQISDAKPQRADAERNVDRKQIGPRSDRENTGGNRGAGRGGDRNHHGVDADPAPQLRARIDMPDQRHVDTHDPGGTEALKDAGDGQERQRVSEHAKQRRDRKQQ